MPAVSKFPLGFSNDINTLKGALKASGLSDEHFVRNQNTWALHINLDGTMLHAKQVTNPEGDLNTYFLYYSTTLIATTSIKTGKYASQQYEITHVHKDAFVNLPSSLIGEKPKIVEAESQTTGFEDIPDWNMQTQVHLHPNKIKNIVREAIKRVLKDPAKEYIVMNVMGACADKVMKAEIHQDYLDALKNKQIASQKPVTDEPVGPSLDKEALDNLSYLTSSKNKATEFKSTPDELVGPSLDNELPLLNNKLPSLDDELPSLDDELPSLDDELPSLDDELPSLDDELPSLDDELPSLDDELPSLDDELLSLDDELPSLDDELPSLDDELPSLDDELPSLDDELPSLDDELPSLSVVNNATPEATTARNRFNGAFPLHPVEGMEYLFKKLNSKIIIEKVGRIYYITPNDESITILEKNNGVQDYYVLCINHGGVASTMRDYPVTSLDLGKVDEQLGQNNVEDDISLSFFVPPVDDNGELPPQELDSPNDDVSLSFYLPPADDHDDKLPPLEVKLPQSDDQANPKNKISSFNTNIGMFPSPKSKKAKEATLPTEESIKEQIQSLLTKGELQIVPVEELARLPQDKLLAFCQKVKESRHVYQYGYEVPNMFLSGVDALLRRGISLRSFLSFPLEKQVYLANEGCTWRFADRGGNLEKLCQLEIEDIKDIFSWLRADSEKTMNFILTQRNAQSPIAGEMNQMIEDKLTSVSSYSFS